MKLWILVLSLFFLIPVFAYSQTGKQVLTLNDCIEIALQNNANINTYRNLSRIAELGKTQSYSSILPQINFRFDAGRYEVGDATYLGDAVDPVTGEVSQITLTRPAFKRNSHSANINLSQNIFDGGYWWNNIRYNKVLNKAAKQDLQYTENQVIKTVAQYYYDLLKQKKLLEVYSAAVKRSQDQLDRTQSMYEIGSVAQVDVYRARVNLGQDQISYLQQKNTVDQAVQMLNLAMGRDPLTDVDIDSTISVKPQELNLDDLLQNAFVNQPELKSMELNVRSQELSVAMAKSPFLPNVSFGFNYNRDNELFKQIYTDFNKNWTISYGIRISYNLFNGFSDMVNYQTSRIQLKNSKISFEDYKRNLTSNIKVLQNNYNAILEIVEIDKKNLEAAREEYRLANERYRLGSGTSLELREAQVNLTQAEQILVSAEYNTIINYLELQEAIGKIQTALNL